MNKLSKKQTNAILAKNPNKKMKKELNNLGRAGDFNGYAINTGYHKNSKHKTRQEEKEELKQIINDLEL